MRKEKERGQNHSGGSEGSDNRMRRGVTGLDRSKDRKARGEVTVVTKLA